MNIKSPGVTDKADTSFDNMYNELMNVKNDSPFQDMVGSMPIKPIPNEVEFDTNYDFSNIRNASSNISYSHAAITHSKIEVEKLKEQAKLHSMPIIIIKEGKNMDYREFKIPKKSGKFRKICAPNNKLLNYQRKSLNMLYEYYYSIIKGTEIEHVAHGFLPGRNVVSAANQHIGYESTTMLDISNFFDTVTKDMLPSHLIDSHFFHKEGYCAQGFATSPILANIATIDIVRDIITRLYIKFPTGFVFTIYADDIQISLKRTSPKNIKELISIVREELNKAGFELNENKTRTKYAKYGWRRILGVNVGDTEVRATRKTMRKIRAARHANNGNSLGGLVNWSNCNLPNQQKRNKSANNTSKQEWHDNIDEILSF